MRRISSYKTDYIRLPVLDNLKIAFWNNLTGCGVRNLIGCSVHGFSTSKNWYDPDERIFACWNKELYGLTVSGSYSVVIQKIFELKIYPELCILFFRHSSNIELFLKALTRALPNTKFIGGGSSRIANETLGEISPDGEDVTLLIIPQINFEIRTLNIYDETNIRVEIRRTTDRQFRELRPLPNGKWENATDFLNLLQKSFKVGDKKFELITFSDEDGRNIHCRTDGNSIFTGANLPDDNILIVRTITEELAEKRVAEFVKDNNALIFGCAGIRSLLRKPVLPGRDSLLGFMFGELFIANNDKVLFGNLMLTKLILKN